jgi:putative ABC transport system ATP-binding protein
MSSTREPVVEAIGVTRVFGTDGIVTALDNVCVAVAAGEFVAIQGPSGCGKSTLLHLLAGLDVPTSGTIRFNGVDLRTLDDDERAQLRRRWIGMVLPLLDLVPTMTTWENVAIASVLDGGAVNAGRDRAEELLGLVKLAHRVQTTAARLSTGETQRVTLARALYNDPELIVADEPTSFLDSVRSDEVVGLLRQLANDGRTIIMATHDSRAAAHADRSVRLLDGRVVAAGIDPRAAGGS